MKQIARNITSEDGEVKNACYLIHDRDGKYAPGFDALFQGAGIQPLKLPPQSPNLNAFAGRWVRSVKEECQDPLILFGERSLRYALDEYLAHFHLSVPLPGRRMPVFTDDFHRLRPRSTPSLPAFCSRMSFLTIRENEINGIGKAQNGRRWPAGCSRPG